MGLQRVVNKILNRSAIGNWRKDRLTGVWPRISFAGEKYVRLWYFEINDHGFHVPQYIDKLDNLDNWRVFPSPTFSGGARRVTHYRWENITVSMLELADEAELPSIAEIYM